ncbi:MAG: alpha/beta hydrolase fold domain-containing protein [Bacteroidia bacterium]
MKKSFIQLVLFVSFLTGCSSDDNKTSLPADDTSVAKELANVAYGTDPQQTMDVYLPANRTQNTTVILLIHGGAWISGSKEDFADYIPTIKAGFPDCAIVNINYRLATETSAAFPKQTDDLKSVFDYLENRSGYTLDNSYLLVGASAGAHLAMLYGYKYDTYHEVKAIGNIVGPADFLDPAYISHPLYPLAAQYLLGTSSPSQMQIQQVNPVSHITAQAPPTISFYGGADPLIPNTQGPRLKQALDAAGIANSYNFYPNGGHGDWDDATMDDALTKLTLFLQQHL